mmetsp:Transcript_36659/g.81579  ORF Transcript_36659/g.81579 Transcript_36659/m.81579 type:complete len:267 (+) Transcript_36659:835-1635(+)
MASRAACVKNLKSRMMPMMVAAFSVLSSAKSSGRLLSSIHRLYSRRATLRMAMTALLTCSRLMCQPAEQRIMGRKNQLPGVLPHSRHSLNVSARLPRAPLREKWTLSWCCSSLSSFSSAVVAEPRARELIRRLRAAGLAGGSHVRPGASLTRARSESAWGVASCRQDQTCRFSCVSSSRASRTLDTMSSCALFWKTKMVAIWLQRTPNRIPKKRAEAYNKASFSSTLFTTTSRYVIGINFPAPSMPKAFPRQRPKPPTTGDVRSLR